MKRIFIALASALIVASGANAATMSIDTDKASYDIGELVTVTATLNIVAGDLNDSAVGTAISLEAGWDSSAFRVANGDLANDDFGTSSQIVTVSPTSSLNTSNLSALNGAIPFTGGSPNGCVSAGGGAGNVCIMLSQSLLGLAFGPDVGQTLVGTLVLEAIGLGAGGATGGSLLSVVSAAYLGGGITGPGSVSVGENFASATVVPEPTTAAMLGLGLLGLSFAGRRRN